MTVKPPIEQHSNRAATAGLRAALLAVAKEIFHLPTASVQSLCNR